MRIITGAARGCRLETLPGRDTRPTADRVKEGIFSAVQFELEGRMVLDLFAGSGQLGLEALSRGACGCVFVDRSPAAAAVVKRNLKAVSAYDNMAFDSGLVQVVTQDSLSYLRHTQTEFDMVLIDPPYGAGLLGKAIRAAAEKTAPGGVIVCETDGSEEAPEHAGAFSPVKKYRYGRIVVLVYRAGRKE